MILWVSKPFLDVKGQWKDVPDILTFPVTELFHVVEQSFLVREMEVVLEMVIESLVLQSLCRHFRSWSLDVFVWRHDASLH